MEKNEQINREEMLSLTRRMTVKRTSMTRIAGCYADKDGFIDGTFNVNFLKLSPAERGKNLEIAKTIPFAKTNEIFFKTLCISGICTGKYEAVADGNQGLWLEK